MLPVSRASIIPSEKEPQGSFFCPYSVAGWKLEPNKNIDGHGAHPFIIVGDEDLMENHGNEIWKLINHVAGMGGIVQALMHIKSYPNDPHNVLDNWIPTLLIHVVGLWSCCGGTPSQNLSGALPSPRADQHHEEISLGNLRRFDLMELQIATSDLSSESILVEGAFGSVCEGVLHYGTWIAVNRLKYANAIGAEVQLH